MNRISRKYNSISGKLLSLVIVPIFIVSLLLGIYFTVTRIHDVNESLIQKGNLIAGNLAPSVEFGLFSRNVPFLESLSDPLLADDDVVSVTILDKNRLPVAVSVSDKYTKEERLANDDISVFESAVYSTRFNPTDFPLDDQPQRGVVNIQPELMGWIEVKLCQISARQRQYEIVLNALLFILLGVVVSGFIAYRMAKRIIQPIFSLTNTVREISDGNLAARSQADAEGELLLLQQGVNSMAEIVQHSQQKLQQKIALATYNLTETIAKLEEKNTSLNSAQAELLSANAAKSEFLAKMSHEIRTPLTAVMGFSRLIESAKDKADIEAYTRVINQSGRQLLNIIDDILSFEKLEGNKHVMSIEDINVRDMIDDVLRMLSPAAKAKKIALVAEVSNDIPCFLRADVVKLSQVLINLVNNAIKFTESGYVFVNLSVRDSYDEKVLVEFEVIDTGIGIAAEDAVKIFASFSQVESDKSRAFEGTGLGLSISKKLVGVMGGEIAVDTLANTSVNTEAKLGSRFWFTIPMGLSEKAGDIDDLQSLKQTVVLCDNLNVSSRALSKILLSWKVDLYVCANTAEMQDLLFLPDIEVDTLIISLDYEASIAPYMLDLLKTIRQQFSANVIFLCSDISETLRKTMADFSSENFSSIRLFEKPVSRQRLYQALLSAEKRYSRQPVSQKNSAADTNGRADGKARILVAEDNEFNAILIRELLSERGIDCVRVADAEALLAALKRHKYDLLLLDVHMPGMDGLTLASEIRQKHYVDETVPLIAFTADVYVLNDAQLHQMGMNDVLHKPLSDDSLDCMLALWLPGYVADTDEYHLSDSMNQRLQDDVLSHLSDIEKSYDAANEAEMKTHIHQLDGLLVYFQFEEASLKLRELKAHALARRDDAFRDTLSTLISLAKGYKC